MGLALGLPGSMSSSFEECLHLACGEDMVPVTELAKLFVAPPAATRGFAFDATVTCGLKQKNRQSIPHNKVSAI